jgi:YVTN family beta-propeller protein
MKTVLKSLLLISAILFSACDEESDRRAGQFAGKVFVVNEGNFNEADGTISAIDPSTASVTHDVFGSVNNGRALGDVVQSMTLHADRGYIVVNNSNKIEVVDANSFESLYAIEGLALPRYLIVSDGKGYVTEWVSFSDPGRVSVIDLSSHSVTGSVDVGYGAEDLIVVNDKIFVSNSFANSVSVVDTETLTVRSTIEVGNSPASFLLDKDGKLWVICQGGFDPAFNPLDDGKLVQIDPVTNSVLKTIDLNQNVSGKGALDPAKANIFYYAGQAIYKVGIAATEKPASPFISEPMSTGFYGIGVDPRTGILYVSDASAFATNGKTFRYSSDGELIDIVSTDRGPNGFVFNY